MGIRIAKRWHGQRCPYCARQMDRFSERLYPTRDHVQPKSRGGELTVICCLTCNGIKGDMLPDVWEAFMRAFPRWWTLTVVEVNRARRSAFAARPEQRLVPGAEALGHRVEGDQHRVALDLDHREDKDDAGLEPA